ncbi:MAG: hypothetical protein COA54_00820 [Thiotrichaceae bacterium]|nr:MAG: hypothetical protein COA54_00820 [Thiotrichaceae bacterium]
MTFIKQLVLATILFCLLLPASQQLQAANLPYYMRFIAYTPPNLYLRTTRATTAYYAPINVTETLTFTLTPAIAATTYIAEGPIPFTLTTFSGLAACTGLKNIQATLDIIQGATTTNLGNSNISMTGTGFIDTFNFNIFNTASRILLNPGDIIRLQLTNNSANTFCPVNEFPLNGTDNDATHLDFETSPFLTISKSSAVLSDPVNLSNPKAIPGSIQQYTIDVSNGGSAANDVDTLAISDDLPAGVLLRFGVGDNPITFIDTNSSGLTYTFVSLGDAGDDIEFYNNGGTTLVTPTVVGNTDATVPRVDRIIIRPKGSFNNSTVAPFPGFRVQFNVEMQ